MPDDRKKIFVTYRRALSTDFVHRLRDHLKARDFDVFVDVQSIPSGKYAATILHQIEARPHFLAILVPGSLERTTENDDWYRREVEHALGTRRNVIPLLAKGFSFADEHQRLRRKTLPGRLEELKQYQHLSFLYEYDEQFEANIDVLVKRFLVIPEQTTVVPTPQKERGTVQQLSKLADLATSNAAGTDWILPPHAFRIAPLPAPKLEEGEPPSALFERQVTWSAVPGAAGYLLQTSRSPTFAEPKVLYAGEQTEFAPLSRFRDPLHGGRFRIDARMASLMAQLNSGPPSGRYYRVKARGGLDRPDSPWSNVVKVEPPRQLAAPKLAGPPSRNSFNKSKFTWTAIEGAAGYLLQGGTDQAFSEPKDIYDGPNTAFDYEYQLIFAYSFHRVKAKAGAGMSDSPWSNVVVL